MASDLLRQAARLLGMTVPRPDPRIPDQVGLTEAARILGLHRNTVLKRAKAGQLMASRLDGGKGDWVFLRAHIVAVARAERRVRGPRGDETGPRLDQGPVG